ncbi:YncE family protein [Castellaniella sp.]|uniref:YncE family protein n=1 Tax=Castellaniella sp. TaxID=1955812 RepID=UPI002AFE6D2E|nr:YncE family protein [Castellaniella sp.]
MMHTRFTRFRLPSAGRVSARLGPLVLCSVLAACAAPGGQPDKAGLSAQTQTQTPAQQAVLRRDLAPGLYELVVADGSVFVASSGSSFDASQGGTIYRLDPDTLETRAVIPTARKPYALAYDARADILYAGNTLNGAVQGIDLKAGQSVSYRLGLTDAKGRTEHVRQIVLDASGKRLFATNPGADGKVWIVDLKRGAILHTLTGLRKWPAGAAYDPAANRLYIGQGGEYGVTVVDPDSGKVLRRFAVDGAEPFLVNIALDDTGTRLFAADANSGRLVVFDTSNGAILATVPVGESALDVLYNPIRGEIYLSNRGASRKHPQGTGAITVIDATTYAVKTRYDLPAHPNSLALSADGQALFATIKGPHDDKHPAYRADGMESVVRIALQ